MAGRLPAAPQHSEVVLILPTPGRALGSCLCLLPLAYLCLSPAPVDAQACGSLQWMGVTGDVSARAAVW